MLNRTPPPNNKNTSDVLNAYRKRRQQRGPLLIYGVTALVAIGLIVLAVWLLGSGQKPLSALFATDTPTPTLTFTPTNTNTPTLTPTLTLTPTITITPTPTGPVAYTIVENDTLQAIAEKFNLGPDGVLLILDANSDIMKNNGVYYVGQTISIPPIGTLLKTATPIPANLGRGTKIEYQVLPGDTLAGIAAKFNSKEEDIATLNKIENANALQAGQTLQIPVNLVTATATLPPTSTPVTPTIEGQSATATPANTAQASASTQSSSAQCAYQENNAYVTDLQTLINNKRKSSGLTELSTNTQLAIAALGHAKDMACNYFFGHQSETNGSRPEKRVADAGATSALVVETIYASKDATPQQALDWWLAHSVDTSNILNTNTTQIGIAYVKADESLFGGYFVVVMAKP